MRPVAVVMCFFFCASVSFSQVTEPDTIMQLEVVTITSQRLDKFTKGQVVRKLDTLTRMENPEGTLSELIPGFSSAYVRDYGQGISTLSIRGTSANHSGLFWNGVRVSPPNIGYVDLSLVQGDFFRDISIMYGGGSSMFGSGAIGGGIHLDNRPVFDSTRLSGGLGVSTFNYGGLYTNGNLEIISRNFYTRSAMNISSSKNDFIYKDLDGNKVRLGHAGAVKGGFLQDLAVRLPNNQYLMGSVWFQYADREIPPTMTESRSVATQLDRAWRSMLVWKDFNAKNWLEAKIAWFNDYTRFSDSIAGVYSVIHSQALVTAFESTLDLARNSALFAGISYSYDYADLDYYDAPEDQQDLALYASWTQSFPSAGWQVSLNARQEFLTGFRAPFLYSLGSEGRIWKALSARISFSRNYRAPTLNERFWQPGGNPDVAPEGSYNIEAGLSYAPELWNVKQELIVTGFSSWVDNWILWVPGTGFWYVENAQKVWSRGLEAMLNMRGKAKEADILLDVSYSLTFSTNRKDLAGYDDSYGKQLIYTPVHRLLVKPGVGWKGFRATLQGNLTGIVYTSRDNDYYLPGYFLLDCILSKSFHIHKTTILTIQAKINNVTDKRYEVVPYRPMPGINAMGTATIQF